MLPKPLQPRTASAPKPKTFRSFVRTDATFVDSRSTVMKMRGLKRNVSKGKMVTLSKTIV